MIGVEARNLKKYYRVNGEPVKALDNFTARIEPGATVSVVGYSGCGKTTFLRVVAGLERPDEGTVEFTSTGGRKRNSGRVGMVFQENRLLPWMTVEENMTLALLHVDGVTDKQEIINDTLRLIGIPDFRRAYPRQLSGGMAQRVALGRALCRRPDMLLMDEPFGALDALTRHNLHWELRNVFADSGVTIILVTHDVTEAILLGTKVLVVTNGRVARDMPIPFSYPRDASSPDFICLRDDVLRSILNK